MKQWNPESLNERYLLAAENAEQYALECKAKAATSEAYKALHDEHLAKFYVFNHLRERVLCTTRSEFISELRSFLHAQLSASQQAFDDVRFLEWRQRFITMLIREVGDE